MSDNNPLPPPPSNSSSCLIRGCLILVAAIVLMVVVLGVGGVYLYRRGLDHFTSPRAVDVQVTPPTQAESQNARANFERLRRAVVNNQEQTVVFTANELNAIVAEQSEFAGARGRVRFAMADSIMTLDLSVPIDSVPLVGMKERWFNGSARFRLNFSADQFDVVPLELNANEWSLPKWLFSSNFAEAFSRSFTRSFHDALQSNREGSAFWRRIKSVKVEGDKLIVSTQPAGE